MHHFYFTFRVKSKIAQPAILLFGHIRKWLLPLAAGR